MDKTAFNQQIAKARDHADWADMEIVATHGPWPVPLASGVAGKYTAGVAFVVRVQDTKRNEPFTVSVAVAEDAQGAIDYKLGCPTSLLTSGMARLSELEAVVEALRDKIPDVEPLSQSVAELHGRYVDSGACNFMSLSRQGKLCGHVAAALVHLVTLHPDLADTLAQKYKAFMQATPGTSPAPQGTELRELERYAFKVPIAIEGERGGGKTYDAYALGRKLDVPVVLQPGHEGIEPADMLGYMVQAGSHGFVWMDGPVTLAFRKAKTQRVILLIDEILRIPQRQLSALLTALTPDEFDGVYRLPTGRVYNVSDGVAEAEVLTCPIENLCVIATTNVGAEYAVDDWDPAMRERFHIIQRNSESDKVRSVLLQRAAARGWSEDLVSRMMTFYSAMRTMLAQGNLKAAPTTRLMARAITVASSAKAVAQELYDMNLQWVARNANGQPSVEQQKLIRMAVNKAFDTRLPEPKGKAT